MTDLYVRPGNILPLFSRLYPNAWKQVDEFRARKRNSGIGPTGAFCRWREPTPSCPRGRPSRHRTRLIMSAYWALAAWRVTQEIYGSIPRPSTPFVDPCHQGHSYVPTDSASLRFVSVMMSSHRGAPDSPLTPGDVESSVSYGRRPLRESLDIRALPPGRQPRPSGERQTGVTGRFPERRAEPTFLADEMSAPADFQVNDAVSE